MKKTLLALLAACLLLSGCAGRKAEDPAPGFVGKRWVRTTESCAETIRFRADGSCSYSCACGDPVGDADLWEGYRYDAQSATIRLDCLEEGETTLTCIGVVSWDETTLVLDFDGDIRSFTAES